MKVNQVIARIALAVSALLTSVSYAGVTGSTIDKILVYDGDMLVYVYPVGGVTNPPACHGSNGDYYSFSINRPMAKEYLSVLLAAQARNASVILYGKGACEDQSVSETLFYLQINR